MYMCYCVVSLKMHQTPFSVYKSLRPKYFSTFDLNKTGVDGMSFLSHIFLPGPSRSKGGLYYPPDKLLSGG